jgi:hypothetical protein
MFYRGGDPMNYRTNTGTVKEMERLFKLYETEIADRVKDGCLTNSTAHTYLLHVGNLIEWCKGNFMPGGTKLKRGTRPY